MQRGRLTAKERKGCAKKAKDCFLWITQMLIQIQNWESGKKANGFKHLRFLCATLAHTLRLKKLLHSKSSGHKKSHTVETDGL